MLFRSNDTAYEIQFGDWSSDVCSSDLRADAWTNGGALVQRMNIAVALTSGRMGGVAAPVLPTIDGGTAEARASAMARALLLRDASPATIRTVAQAKTPRDMAALILGSPEFQRR